MHLLSSYFFTDVAIECFEKSRKKQPLLPLQTENTFHILHNGCVKSRSNTPTSSVEPTRARARSCSPTKRVQTPACPKTESTSSTTHVTVTRPVTQATSKSQTISTTSTTQTSVAQPRFRQTTVSETATRKSFIPSLSTPPVRNNKTHSVAPQPRTALRSSVIQSHVIKDHNIKDKEEIIDLTKKHQQRPISVPKMATSRPHFQRKLSIIEPEQLDKMTVEGHKEQQKNVRAAEVGDRGS